MDNVLAPYFDLKGKLERINQVLNAKRVAYEDALVGSGSGERGREKCVSLP